MQLTVRDVARMLHVPEKTVHRWVSDDRLPATKVGGQFRFNPTELFEWATVRKLEISPEVFPETQCAGATASLIDALRCGGVMHGISGPDKESVLRQVVAGMRLPESFDRDLLIELLISRESLGSTGVGDGIAIPHPRYPVVLPVPQAVATLCFLDQAIDFSAADGRPVDTLFVLICPSVRSHLQLLTQLAAALRDAQFRAVVSRKGSTEEILAETSRYNGTHGNAQENGTSSGTSGSLGSGALMTLLLVAVGLLLASGVAALAASAWPRVATFLGATGATIACGVGLVPAWQVFVLRVESPSITRDWPVPDVLGGNFVVAVDRLSAFFLLPILVVSALASIYGSQYMLRYRDRKSLGVPWFFFNAMLASMIMVMVARNAVLFLIAWEVMSLASYFLITFDDERPEVCRAGRIYLIAAHLGTAFLLAFFILLGRQADSLDFDRLSAEAGTAGSSTSVLFILALIGFGTKAGLMPFHVWGPEAYPVAPHHHTAVLSGAMSKIGIYGIVRALMLLGPAEYWWPWVLIGIGFLSGILGVLFALAQRNLKRLLAYSSVENVGIIAMGLGTGLLGVREKEPALAVLGFAGALLHVANHSLFKGLLFLGAGTVEHTTGTLDIERLGGLAKRIPWTASAFLVGCVAISGLPPLNGFMSEFLIYLGAFREEMFEGKTVAVPALLVIAGLALIGGLAAVCFTKAFGMVFLGNARSKEAAAAPPTGLRMRLPVLALVLACLVVSFAAPVIVPRLEPAVSLLMPPSEGSGFSPEKVQEALNEASRKLARVALIGGGLLVLIAALALFRKLLLATRSLGRTATWGCGYIQPTSRMQYTGSSYVEPLTTLLNQVVQTRRQLESPSGYFPKTASLATETPDIWHERVYQPAFAGLGWAMGKLRWLQHGLTHLYVLYIALTLMVLLVWYLRQKP